MCVYSIGGGFSVNWDLLFDLLESIRQAPCVAKPFSHRKCLPLLCIHASYQPINQIDSRPIPANRFRPVLSVGDVEFFVSFGCHIGLIRCNF